MNGGWKRLNKSEIISLTLMELLLLLSFVCLIVIKEFYEDKQAITGLISNFDKIVAKGGGRPSSEKSDPIPRIKDLLIYFEKLPPGWTNLQPPAPEKQVLLKQIEALKNENKELKEGTNKLQEEVKKMLADLKKVDPKAASKYAEAKEGGGGAPGKSPCMVDENNKIVALYSITVAEGDFFVKPIYTSNYEKHAKILPKIERDGMTLKLGEFRNIMKLIIDTEERNHCTYYAEIKVKDSISVSASTRGINTVNSYFYQYGPIQIVKE